MKIKKVAILVILLTAITLIIGNSVNANGPITEWTQTAEMDVFPDEQESPWLISPYAAFHPEQYNWERYFIVDQGILKSYVAGVYIYPSIYARYYKPLDGSLDGNFTFHTRARILGPQSKAVALGATYRDQNFQTHFTYVNITNYWNNAGPGVYVTVDNEYKWLVLSDVGIEIDQFHLYEIQFSPQSDSMLVELKIDGQLLWDETFNLDGVDWIPSKVHGELLIEGTEQYGAVHMLFNNYSYQSGGSEVDYVRMAYNQIPEVTCVGFEPPMDAGPVKVKKNRVLPLKAQLYSDSLTDGEIGSAPVIQVLFDPGLGADPTDVTDQALSVGMGTDGNQFVWSEEDEKWQFNLKTKNYTATGTYTVTMLSGDDTEYEVQPTCEAIFVIE